MVKTFKINKMSRDKDPANMQNDNMKVTLKSNITSEDKLKFYKAKLVEESLEVQEALSEQELIEELADCLEVIDGLIKAFGLSRDRVQATQAQKRLKRGGFEKAMIIDTVDVPADHYQAEIFASQPHKYPELEEIES